MKSTKRFVVSLFLCFSILCLASCASPTPQHNVGVWWWDNRLDDSYLNFAKNNKVNEIYFYDSDLNEKSKNFITKALQFDIAVYWLIGKKEWLNDYQSLYNEIDRLVQYNTENPYSQYKGVHLDIEPHQFDNFEENRYQLIYNLIEIAYNLKQLYPTIHFEFDIPFWLHDGITFNEVTKPAYAHMIDIADRVILMSYRNTAKDVLAVSKEEIEYAKSTNKTLVLGVETGETNETDNVTFFEDGKNYMYQQLAIVKQSLPENFSIAIHHIKTWQQLKN